MWKVPEEEETKAPPESYWFWKNGFSALYSKRELGDMTSVANQARFLFWASKLLGVPEEGAHLVPSPNAVSVVKVAKRPGNYSGDALITTRPDIRLTILPAGCLIIFMRDKAAGLVGLIHGSRVSLNGKIVEKTMSQWVDMGGKPRTTEILFAPHVQSCCYVFSAKSPVLQQLGPEWEDALNRLNGLIALSLKVRALTAYYSRGFFDIHDSGICVGCQKEFFLNSRDGGKRNLATIWLG